MLRPGFIGPLALALPLAAAAQTQGRWEGSIQVPGAPQPIVLDFDGRAGAVTLPGRGVSGAPLRDLQAGPERLTASLAAAVPTPDAAAMPSSITLERQADGRLAGTFRQGGHAAPVVLVRSGDAQVPAPRTGSAISAALAGTWTGRYELFYPREVTLTLKEGPPAPGNARLVIVGQRHNDIVVDRVVEGPALLVVEASEAGMTIEGRLVEGRIEATLVQGPIELPLVLRRAGGRP